jgi:hypothetical protein
MSATRPDTTPGSPAAGTATSSAEGRAGAPPLDATSAFSTSVLISAVRCTLTYVVFPWLLPLLGLAKGVGPIIGIAIGGIAIVFNVLSIRRFMISRHRMRWAIAALNVSVIVLLLVLMVQDVRAL